MNANVIHSPDCSAEPLIDWYSAETVINTTYEVDYYNNPFDMMEFKAANMDVFDLVPNQTPLRGDVSCSGILTTSWKLEIGPIMKSFSSTDDNDDESLDRSTNEEPKNESVCPLTAPDDFTIDVEKIGLCNEEEKQEIREQTQQRIYTLIETVENKYKKYHVQKSLIFMAQRFADSSLNSTGSLFNNGFMCDGSVSNSYRKTPDNSTVDINDNSTLSSSLMYSNLNSFDLESLRPEWITNSFNNTNESVVVQTENSEPAVEPINNNEIDMNLKALNDIETIKSESIGYQTVLNSIQNKNTGNKVPFLANIPVHHMMLNYMDGEIKNNSFSEINSCSHLKPVASSTPTNTPNNTTKYLTQSSVECSITSFSLQKQAVVNSAKSPITPINTTKCIKHNPTNDNNTIMPPNAPCLFDSTNKHSNTSINLTNEGVQNKTVIIKSFQLNISKSDSAIVKTPKSLALTTSKLSSLPVPKRTTVLFKEKGNVKM